MPINTSGEPRDCPKYLKLAKTFERQLRAGVLRVGDRLPSVRQLRTHHRVSAATAVGCYMWLERQGYVRARPKSGFFVSRTPQAEGPAPEISARARGPLRINMGGLPIEPTAAADRSGYLDLGPAVVGAGLLPMARLNRSIRLALSAFGDNAVKYQRPARQRQAAPADRQAGVPPGRHLLSRRHRRHVGVDRGVQPERARHREAGRRGRRRNARLL